MLFVLLPLTEQKTDNAYKEIAQMRSDLESYAKKPDSKETYIDKINNRINTLLDTLESYDDLIKAFMDERTQTYQSGFRDGLKRGREESQAGQFTDKEGYRMQTIVKAQQSMPNLF